MTRCQSLAGAAIVGTLLGTASAGAFEYGTDPDPRLEIDSSESGARTGHRLRFRVRAGELETYRARIRYPGAFRFRGFSGHSSDDAVVGRYAVDRDLDDAPDVEADVRSLSATRAYVDLDGDGRFALGLEPALDVLLDEIRITLPFGGDVDPTTLLAPADAAVTVTLAAGVLENPDEPGTYTVAGELVSVDPDTDDFDDGQGEPPLVFEVELPVEIEAGAHPGSVPFEDFGVRKAWVRTGPRKPGPWARKVQKAWVLQGQGKPRPSAHEGGAAAGRGSFGVSGWQLPGRDSDGIDPGREGVVVRFGEFEQHLPASGFRRRPKAWVYETREPGVRLALRDDGRFFLRAWRADLGAIDLRAPVAFGLRVGDDFGEASILFDARGSYHRD